MRKRSGFAVFTVGFGALLACDSASTNPNDLLQNATLSVYLTDAPGDVAAVWVDIAEIYFQGGPEGRQSVLSESTGLVELTSLQDRAVEIVGGLDVDPGTYSQLRFVLSAAVLEATNGEVYGFGDAVHPDGLEITGELKCPSCSSSGLKVQLKGDELAIEDGGNSLVLDFDVAQSFGRPAGQSGKWVMSPVIHGVKSQDGEDPEAPGAGSEIAGTVALANDAAGAPVEIPACPAETPRTLRDFVPLAVAINLVDDVGDVFVRAGEVREDGSFSIGFLDPDTYTMSHMTAVEVGSMQLVFEATVVPETAEVAAGSDVSGVEYVIESAVCEEIPTGG